MFAAADLNGNTWPLLLSYRHFWPQSLSRACAPLTGSTKTFLKLTFTWSICNPFIHPSKMIDPLCLIHILIRGMRCLAEWWCTILRMGLLLSCLIPRIPNTQEFLLLALPLLYRNSQEAGKLVRRYGKLEVPFPCCLLRGPTGISTWTHTLYSLHAPPQQNHQQLWNFLPLLCRWHTTIRENWYFIIFISIIISTHTHCLFGGERGVDEPQLSPT